MTATIIAFLPSWSDLSSTDWCVRWERFGQRYERQPGAVHPFVLHMAPKALLQTFSFANEKTYTADSNQILGFRRYYASRNNHTRMPHTWAYSSSWTLPGQCILGIWKLWKYTPTNSTTVLKVLVLAKRSSTLWTYSPTPQNVPLNLTCNSQPPGNARWTFEFVLRRLESDNSVIFGRDRWR